jgi:hypothetical protein
MSPQITDQVYNKRTSFEIISAIFPDKANTLQNLLVTNSDTFRALYPDLALMLEQNEPELFRKPHSNPAPVTHHSACICPKCKPVAGAHSEYCLCTKCKPVASYSEAHSQYCHCTKCKPSTEAHSQWCICSKCKPPAPPAPPKVSEVTRKRMVVVNQTKPTTYAEGYFKEQPVKEFGAVPRLMVALARRKPDNGWAWYALAFERFVLFESYWPATCA